jgi:ubiquinol-cytochrome c reductase iron-sulfur subunit
MKNTTSKKNKDSQSQNSGDLDSLDRDNDKSKIKSGPYSSTKGRRLGSGSSESSVNSNANSKSNSKPNSDFDSETNSKTKPNSESNYNHNSNNNNKNSSNTSSSSNNSNNDENRRDFLTFAASGFVGVGAACAAWPLVDSMNPAEDVLANSSIEVDLENIKSGQSVTIKWRGKPIFIKNRTPEEIMESRNADIEKLRDSEPDEKRVKPSYDKWLVVVGVCTHLGCVPISEQSGWFCPCHGSYYDNSGRVVAGPAPKNLEVPPYEFITDTKIKIG